MNNLIEAEKIIKPELDKIDDIVFLNSKKVLDAFQKIVYLNITSIVLLVMDIMM